MVADFFRKSWAAVPFDAKVLNWARRARAEGDQAVRDPALARWWVCRDTWFVGVDALPNDVHGAFVGGEPLGGAPKRAIEALFGAWAPLHPGQLSVVRPGYPQPREGESDAAFGYRLKRDAAHVDGIKAAGADRRRRIDERHAWILGLPLTQNSPGEAPLVVWEGSHEIIRAALLEALAPHAEADWGRVDVTDAYVAARRRVFDTCRRVAVTAAPGAGYVLHRLAVHGVAPWGAPWGAPGPGQPGESATRMVAYFRPNWAGDMRAWLTAP